MGDLGLLDSAIHRPSSFVLGQPAYPTLNLKAAALLQSLTKNHALMDGNRPLAWLATVVFLDIKGHEPNLGRTAAVKLVLAVAGGHLPLPTIAARLKVRKRQ